MGEVYKARDSVINRTVALKTITNNLANHTDLLERFYQEARAAGTLQHPNIVTIFELNKEGETPYIAMEFLEGESLEKIIARKAPLTISEKLGYIVPVCRALDYAHKRGIVHRDVKPANIVVSSDGVVKVVDFGIARLVDGGLTQTNMLIGTIAYMSPQQIQGDRADERSDIWAMGVTCWELVAGERPFNGDNHAALMMKIISGEPPPLSEKDPASPADLDAVVARMINKDIAERFQTMEEVLLELEPVWRRIQLGTVSQLIESGKTLLESQDLLRAQRMLREALQIESSNPEARTLLEKTNAAIRRSQILPKLHERVERGGQLLASGLPQEARAEAEAALKIDSSFAPAKSLLAGVQAANDYARLVGDGLRIAKQFLASGAILDADQKLETVLSLDPQNKTALELREHVREEVERRQKRQSLAESIKRVRELWTEQRYDECLGMLRDLDAQFPGDAEVLHLHDAILQDQQEQEKSARLAEARKLVAKQHFDGALSILSGLVALHPEDSGIKSFRSLVLQQKEGEARQKQTSTELQKLRELLESGKYEEAATRGEALLRESPQDFELREVVKFAREELSQNARKQTFEELIAGINKQILAHQFGEAIKTAERGLLEFPGNSELKELLDSAKLEQKDQEGRERLEGHIREIEALIHKDELTEAIDMARQTLMTVGPSSAITKLLKTAEIEYKSRAKHKDQNLGLVTLQTLIANNKLEEAKSAIQDSIRSELFEPSDPRIATLSETIAERESANKAEPSPATSISGSTPAPIGMSRLTKDYVFQQGPPVISKHAVTEAQQASKATSKTASTPATSASNSLPGASPISADVRPPHTSDAALVGPAHDSAVSPKNPPQPTMASRKPGATGAGEKIIAAAALVLLTLSGGIFAWKRAHRRPPEATAQELALKFEAENLSYDRHLNDAIKKYTQLADLHGALAPLAQQKIQDLTALQQQETSLMADGKAAETAKDLPRARDDYQKTVALQGEREVDAKASLEALDQKQAGLSDSDIATQNFQTGVAAFTTHNYAAAKSAFEQGLQRGGDDWPQKTQAATYARRSAQRIFQAQLLKRAEYEFNTQDFDSARNDAQQVAGNSDGDPLATSEGKKLLAKVVEASSTPGALAAAAGNKNAAAIQQLSTQAETLVQSGLYSAADDKANRIAQLGGNADPTYRLIKDAEEKRFSELNARYHTIDRHNQAELQSLLNAVQQLQNNGFYQKQEARQMADAINVDLRPFAPKPVIPETGSAKSAADDPAEIQRVVMRFAAAFSAGNLNQIREVWRLTPKQEKKFNDTLVAQANAPVTIHDCSAPNIKTQGTGQTAQITCTVDSAYKNYPSKKIKYSLQRDGTRWIIVDSH
jgi:serine/threonine protein kinase